MEHRNQQIGGGVKDELRDSLKVCYKNRTQVVERPKSKKGFAGLEDRDYRR
jgi:hypothetical protein